VKDVRLFCICKEHALKFLKEEKRAVLEKPCFSSSKPCILTDLPDVEETLEHAPA
jgi:hypothetical protein